MERWLFYFDEPTGVYSRGAGLLELRHAIDRCRREKQPMVVVFVDADNLKAVNDGFGHDAGDRLLMRLAQAISQQQRSYDIVIRLGGDEFVCALSNVSPAMADERMRSAADLLATNGGRFTQGVAELRPEDTAQTLIARADAALYDKRRHTRPV